MNKKYLPIFVSVAVFGLFALMPADAFAQGFGALENPVNKIITIIQNIAYIGAALMLVWAGAEMVMAQSGSLPEIWKKIQGLAFGLALMWGAATLVKALVTFVK